MSDEISFIGSILVPTIVSILTLLLTYFWHRRVNSPKIIGLNWLYIPSNISHPYSEGWVCLQIENQKGKLFKWFMDRKEIAESVKGFMKLYNKEKLIYSQVLSWGLTHANPKEISLNVGEVQRLDVLIKTNDGWCITSGRESLKDPIVLSPPIPNQELTIEIIISGKNFAPITSIYKTHFPEGLVKFARENALFDQI